MGRLSFYLLLSHPIEPESVGEARSGGAALDRLERARCTARGTREMRIGFDVSQTGRLKAGCGYFADSLIRGLSEIDATNEYLLYPTFGDFYFDPEWDTTTVKVDGIRVRRGLAHETRDAARAFWSRPPVDVEAQLGHPYLGHAN